MTEDLIDRTIWEGKILLDGWTPAGSTGETREAATGASLAVTGLGDRESVGLAATLARSSQPAWHGTPPRHRAEILRRAARFLTSERAELVEWLIRECGGVRRKAVNELAGAAEELEAASALAMLPHGQVLPNEFGEDLSLAIRVPHGVVGVITPWNTPLLLATRSVAPALAMGNSVILKPDPRTIVSGGIVIARALEVAGLPSGVLTMVPGDAAVGEALVEHPGVAMISFTGSTAVGRKIGEQAGAQLKKAALELGGKSPLIVLADADIDAATSAGAFGSFHHQGQICMATGRHLVHESVADQYLELLARKANELKAGDPFREDVALGPVIDDKQLDRVTAIVDASIAAGAERAAGAQPRGRFIPPTVLAGVDTEMPAFRDEIFGPVAPVTTFDDEEEAIALANRSEYGLVAAIHTADPERGRVIGQRLEAAMIHVNGKTVGDSPYIPFGGMGQSGNASRFGASVNQDTFSQWQWTTIRRRPDRGAFRFGNKG